MLKELEDIGLHEKEAKVYLASLEVGRATADQLAKQAKIVRSTTYVQIESLMKKGLMSSFEEGKKTYFAPESPAYLKRIFELKKSEFQAREKELDTFLPELLKMIEGAGERPAVRFFSGKEGITNMREEALQLKKDEEIIIIFSHDALEHLYMQKESDDFAKKRVAKGIGARYIYTRSQGKFSKELAPEHTTRRFMKPEKMPLQSDIFIFGNKVAIMSLKNHVFGFIVESKEISETFRSLFTVLWEQAEEE